MSAEYTATSGGASRGTPALGGAGAGGSSGSGGQEGVDPLRKYKAGIFGYYAMVLVTCAALAFVVLDLRQRDGWRMLSIGTVQSAIGQRVEGQAVRVVDFRVESVTLKKVEDRTFTFDPFILLVLVAGAVGGSLHGLTSLAEHAGRGTLKHGWGPYYAGLPVTGAGMALAIYYILRSGIAGFEVVNATAPEATYLAWAVLAGLFSSNALQKLGDVFNALFQSREARRRREEAGGTERPQGGVRGGSAQPART